MPDFAQKARAWPKIRAKNRAEKGAKCRFFNSCGGGRYGKPRGCRLSSAKSLSVEQFSCTKFSQSPTYLSFNSYKRERKPYKWREKALVNFAWAVFAPTFFQAKSQKPRGCDSFRIRYLTQNHPDFDPLHFCLPLPPGETKTIRALCETRLKCRPRPHPEAPRLLGGKVVYGTSPVFDPPLSGAACCIPRSARPATRHREPAPGPSVATKHQGPIGLLAGGSQDLRLAQPPHCPIQCGHLLHRSELWLPRFQLRASPLQPLEAILLAFEILQTCERYTEQRRQL